jgi:biopolymer transport protein ExbB/TolQ
MTIGAELIVASISALFSILLTGIVSYIAWKGKGVGREIEKNTQFRQFMTGAESLERDDGELENIDEQFAELRAERQEMRAEMQQSHRETSEQLSEIEEGMAYLTQFVRNIAGAINRSDLDDTIEEPDEYDRPGTWRGGSSEGSDD